MDPSEALWAFHHRTTGERFAAVASYLHKDNEQLSKKDFHRNPVPDPSCRLPRWHVPLRSLSFCWHRHRLRHYEKENTFRHSHLWTAARTRCYFRWNPRANCYGVISNPNLKRKKKRSSQFSREITARASGFRNQNFEFSLEIINHFDLLEIEFDHNFRAPK